MDEPGLVAGERFAKHHTAFSQWQLPETLSTFAFFNTILQT